MGTNWYMEVDLQPLWLGSIKVRMLNLRSTKMQIRLQATALLGQWITHVPSTSEVNRIINLIFKSPNVKLIILT